MNAEIAQEKETILMDEACAPMATYTEELLVDMAQGGEREAFNELMRRSFRGCLKTACYILADIGEAEDQVQNAYLKAWLHLGEFQRQAKFSTWVVRIVTNQCLMRLRQVRGKTFVHLDDRQDEERMRQLEIVDSGFTPEEAFSAGQERGLLRNEIAALPPLLRNVLVLCDLNETTPANAAGQLGITRSAVKSRLLRARAEVNHRWMKREARVRRSAKTLPSVVLR